MIRNALFICITAMPALSSTPLVRADGPGNSWQRWRWPWADGSSYTVTQTVFGTTRVLVRTDSGVC